MAKKTPETAATEAANRQVLADREKRLEKAATPTVDLGLDLETRPEEPATVDDFMDEFDRRAYGDPRPTITKIVYGPDPLVDQFPEFRERLEEDGIERFAEATYQLIVEQGAAALPDPRMRKQFNSAILKFGKAAVAARFKKRIQDIPWRSVEIDASDEYDPEILGSGVLSETIRRYERPGMCYMFLAPRCVDLMGFRGYTLVKDHKGDVVKCGTLMLGEARQERIEARRMKQAEMAQDAIDKIQQSQEAGLQGVLDEARQEGKRTSGMGPIGRGEMMTAEATEVEGYLGETRTAGVRVSRENVE